MARVLVCEKLSPQGLATLTRAGLDVTVKASLSPADLCREIPAYDALLVRSATKVTSDVIEAGTKLRVIGRAGVGLDNVDLAAATRRGILVMNTPGENTVTTAEHTIAMLMAMSRQIPQATASIKGGRWEKGKFLGVELYHKTLGVVGMGQVGSHVTRLAQGLMMRVIGYDPYYFPSDKAEEMGVEIVSLDDLYRRADFITVHTPLTPETRHMIGTAAFTKMKDGVRIINCARGGVVDEAALAQALQSGKVAGAALDVFEQEPVDPTSPLLKLEQVICTPHLGASTAEAQEAVSQAIAEQVVEYLVHGTIRNAANFPAVSADVMPKIQGYLILAEKLGLALAQIYEGPIRRVIIEYRGEAADLTVAPITLAALKGLLAPVLGDHVNYVNARLIAEERGLEVQEVKSHAAGDLHTLVLLRVEGPDGANVKAQAGRVAGTLLGRKEPRLVEINGFTVELSPSGHMLVLMNHDRPGVIGNMGTLLGRHAINISSMELGREQAGGKALSVWGIDSAPPPEVLEAIKALPNVLSVRQIRL